MPTNFPTSVDNFTNPTANDSLNLPSHSTQHANANDAIEAIEGYLLTGAGAAGLVLLKTQAVGSAVSSVTVTGAFTSTYDNYKIIYSDGVGSVSHLMSFRLSGSTSGYSGILLFAQYTNFTVPLSTGDNNATFFTYAGGGDASGSYLNADVLMPNSTKYTRITSNSLSSTDTGVYQGIHKVATAYTDFILIPTSGTITGGTIYVYGYKKA